MLSFVAWLRRRFSACSVCVSYVAISARFSPLARNVLISSSLAAFFITCWILSSSYLISRGLPANSFCGRITSTRT
jgi:hypothetical protein